MNYPFLLSRIKKEFNDNNNNNNNNNNKSFLIHYNKTIRRQYLHIICNI